MICEFLSSINQIIYSEFLFSLIMHNFHLKKQEEVGESKNEVKEKKKKEEEPQEIVLKVDMHCEGCARKVAKSLRGIEGSLFPFLISYIFLLI